MSLKRNKSPVKEQLYLDGKKKHSKGKSYVNITYENSCKNSLSTWKENIIKCGLF